jgi:hypothetical protein
MTHFTDVSMTNFMIMVTKMNYIEQNTISNSGPFLTISLGGQSPPPPSQGPFSLKYKQNIGREIESGR